MGFSVLAIQKKCNIKMTLYLFGRIYLCLHLVVLKRKTTRMAVCDRWFEKNALTGNKKDT